MKSLYFLLSTLLASTTLHAYASERKNDEERIHPYKISCDSYSPEDKGACEMFNAMEISGKKSLINSAKIAGFNRPFMQLYDFFYKEMDKCRGDLDCLQKVSANRYVAILNMQNFKKVDGMTERNYKEYCEYAGKYRANAAKAKYSPGSAVYFSRASYFGKQLGEDSDHVFDMIEAASEYNEVRRAYSSYGESGIDSFFSNQSDECKKNPSNSLGIFLPTLIYNNAIDFDGLTLQ
ncbi:TPA: hypothetical protein ACX3KG_003697 [Raoultella ornithinolytica]